MSGHGLKRLELGTFGGNRPFDERKRLHLQVVERHFFRMHFRNKKEAACLCPEYHGCLKGIEVGPEGAVGDAVFDRSGHQRDDALSGPFHIKRCIAVGHRYFAAVGAGQCIADATREMDTGRFDRLSGHGNR